MDWYFQKFDISSILLLTVNFGLTQHFVRVNEVWASSVVRIRRRRKEITDGFLHLGEI